MKIYLVTNPNRENEPLPPSPLSQVPHCDHLYPNRMLERYVTNIQTMDCPTTPVGYPSRFGNSTSGLEGEY